MGKSLTVSDALYFKLEQAALAKGLTMDQLLTELTSTLPSSNQSSLLQVLRDNGLAPIPASTFADLVDPTVDYEAVRQALARKRFSPALSETIITERG